MNDLFRAIFGIPPNVNHGERMDDKSPEDPKNNFRDIDFSSNFRGNGDDDDDGGGDDDDDDDDDNNMRKGSRGGIFGFPFFNNAIEVHKHLERVVDEMNKAFGIFGFNSGPSITWEDDSSNMSPFFNGQPKQEQESLRDSYLKKPECKCENSNRKDDFNLTLNIETNDLQPGTSNNINSDIQFSYPKIYSKSVYIQTIRRPDGSVETIKKVCDHAGNEKTTITQSNINDPLPPLKDENLTQKDDTSGISILKKFFSF